MKHMTGSGVSAFNSDELASLDISRERDQGASENLVKACERHTSPAAYVPCPFYHSDLETKTDPEEGAFLFSCPFHSEDHAFGPSFAESTGNEDTANESNRSERCVTNDVMSILCRY